MKIKTIIIIMSSGLTDWPTNFSKKGLLRTLTDILGNVIGALGQKAKLCIS